MKKTKYSKSERWYVVEGYEDRYEISTHGRARSCAPINGRGKKRPWQLLRQIEKSSGRRYVTLCWGGVCVKYCFSALLAKAYRIPNPRGCAYIIHKNHDYRDYRRGNLAWATLAELRMHDGYKATSRYYGVYLARGRNSGSRGVLRWTARLNVKGRPHDLGLFPTPEEAAYAYDREVKRLRISRPLNGLSKPAAYRPKIESLPGEIWRRFPGAERTHMISNLGRVRTQAYRTSGGKRVLPGLLKVDVSTTGHRAIKFMSRHYNIAEVLARVFPTRAERSRRSADSSAAVPARTDVATSA